MHKRSQTLRRSVAIAVVVLLASVVAIAAPSANAVTNCTPTSSWGTNRADLASQVVTLINQYRASIGLSQLAASAPLTASSEWKSLHMAGYGYFAHDDPAPPVTRAASQRARDCGYSGSWWGENIAYGYPTAQSVVNGWLSSPGHKANIVNANFTSTGVGVASTGGGQLYWTQSFGNDASGSTPPPAPSPPASTPPAATPPPATPAPTPPASSTPAAPAASTVAKPATAPQAAASSRAATKLPVGAKPAHVTQNKRTRLTASVTFVHTATGRPMASGSVRCRAEVDGKRLRVLANAFKAKSARCAWKIPAWAKGKKFTGVVAVQVGDAAATRLFIRALN